MTTERKDRASTTSLNLCENLLINWKAVAPEKDKEVANVFINILKSYSGLEQQYRIMLEAFKIIHLYAPVPEPTMPKVVFEKWELRKEEYRKQSQEKKNEFWKRLMMDSRCKKYFDDVEATKNKNLSNVLFLEEMITTMQEAKDTDCVPTVIEVYNKYPSSIGNWKKKLYGTKTTDQHQGTEGQSMASVPSGDTESRVFSV